MIENVLTCDDCKQAALDVDKVGYTSDVDDRTMTVKLCDECYEIRCDEIELDSHTVKG